MTTVVSLVEFLRARAQKAHYGHAQRLQASTTWRTETDDEHRLSTQAAARVAGHKVPFVPRWRRLELAAVDEQIASKIQKEAEQFDAAAVRLSAIDHALARIDAHDAEMLAKPVPADDLDALVACLADVEQILKGGVVAPAGQPA